jgi:excisionase family DNA binding protein
MDDHKYRSNAPEDEGAYTVEEFCQRFGIGRTSFYDEVNEGRLTAKKRGSRTLIERAEARRWLASLPDFKTVSQASTLKLLGHAQ